MSLFNTGSSSSGGLFGNNNATSSPSSGSTGIFGAAGNKPATGVFGTTPATGTAPTTGLFGNTGGTATTSGGTGLFGNTSSTGTNPTGGLFGNANRPATTPGSTNQTTAPPATPAAGAPPTNSLFGSFNLPKPTESGKEAPKPATSSFFSQPSTSTPAAGTSSTPATGGGLFGSLKPPENPASSGTSPTTIPAPSGGLFGGSNISGKPAMTPTTTTATSPAPGGTFSLGGNKDGVSPASSGGFFGAKPAEKKDDKPADNATSFTSTGGLGGLFGSTSATKPEEKKDAPATGGLFGSFNNNKPKEGDKPSTTPSTTLGGSTLGGGGSTLSASMSTAPNVTVPPPSMLKGKTIEEIVNKWSSDLETHVREFNKFAAEVSMWDRALIENGNNLAALYSHVLAAERDQNEVDQSLDHIEQQQRDLSATLDAYEKVTQEIFGNQAGSLRALDTGPADTERDKNYMLATDLHTHLDDLSSSLTQMIESVNSLSIPPGENSQEDPMTQISQILSSHLESLQWIDGAVREVESKVTDVEKRVKESGHGASLNGSGVKSPRGFGLRS